MNVDTVSELRKQSFQLKEPGTAANVFATLVATVFHIGIRSYCGVEIIGLNNYTGSPSTLVVSNHKRDLDMLVIAPALHFGDSFPRSLVRPYFAARDDEFAPSFLATYYNLPQWLNRIILYKLDISPVMYAFRAYPMRQAHAATTNQALRETLLMEGNAELGKVAQESWLQRSADSLEIPIDRLKSMTIRDLMSWRYLKILRQKADSSMLQGNLCRRMRLFQGRAIRKQLEYFAELLSQGKTLFLAPEGELSSDGMFCPIRGSHHRLIKMSRRTVKILPMNISYDFMTTGRMKVFLNIGREIPDMKELSKAELELRVKDSLLKLAVVTMSQIGSYSLYREAAQGNDILIEENWQQQLVNLAQKTEEVGLGVDKALLNERFLRKNIKSFVNYCLRKGQLAEVSPGRLRINREIILNNSSAGYSQNPVHYCHNEFSSLLGSKSLSFLPLTVYR